jgi:hypothetical protein
MCSPRCNTCQEGHGESQGETKTRRKMPLAARRKIAKAARERWGKLRRGYRGNHRATNAASPPWTDKDDAAIVQAVKQGRVDASDLTRKLGLQLTHRSPGAIRQRISKLAQRGLLKQHANSGNHSGMPRMVVEAA